MTYAVRGASVTLGSTRALTDVSIEVPAGSVVAVVGGDGAGKTTLIRALVGEVALDHGTVHAPDAHRLGYLPAAAGSWAALTVNQNMDFVGGVYGLVGDDLVRRRDTLLRSAALDRATDRLASDLSGGMRRKLGFCMAMQHRPDLLVLDEPSTGVDPVSRVELWRLVANAAADGAAVLMSTTYLDEAERASHLVVMDRGVVLVQGELDAVLGSLDGIVTATPTPQRREWAWRRGTRFHELWPDPDSAPTDGRIDPDLEDVVIALSLQRRATVEAAP